MKFHYLRFLFSRAYRSACIREQVMQDRRSWRLTLVSREGRMAA